MLKLRLWIRRYKLEVIFAFCSSLGSFFITFACTRLDTNHSVSNWIMLGIGSILLFIAFYFCWKIRRREITKEKEDSEMRQKQIVELDKQIKWLEQHTYPDAQLITSKPQKEYKNGKT